MKEKIKRFGSLCKKGSNEGLTKEENKEFKKLESLCEEDPAMIKQCLEFYRERWQKAQKSLDKIRKGFPEYINPVQNQSLHRAVLGAEMDTIEELNSKNEIPEQVALKIHSEIENKLRRLKYIKKD